MIATDDFDREENPLTKGGKWTKPAVSESGGTVYDLKADGTECASTQAGAATCKMVWTGDSFSANQYSQATYGTGGGWGVCVRCSDGATGTNDYRLYWSDAAQRWRFYKHVNGTESQLGVDQSTPALQSGHKMRLKVVGNLLTAAFDTGSGFVDNGYTQEDSDVTIGKPGLMIYDVAATADDWEGGDVGAGFPAYGEETPDSDEQAKSWTTFEISNGVPCIVSGDPDWGKALVDNAIPIYGPVEDKGNVDSKTFTVTPNKHGTGSGTPRVYIRGDETAFTKFAGSPSWVEYTAPFAETWRYVQLRLGTG